ncbi:hypothetical protein GIB67_039947, partial [Kingdonia uniflora]
MAIGDESSSIISSIGSSEDVQSFNYVHDNLNLKIISQLLDNLSYVRWAKSVKLFVGLPWKDKGTQTLGMYYARLRSSWEKLSHYDSFIEWPTSAPSKYVPTLPLATKIYAKIVEKTRVFHFFVGFSPDFEYARVHLLDMTLFPILDEAHAYCLSDQSRRLPIPHISRIPLETFTMAVRYAYPTPPLVPLQTSHTSSPSLSPLPAVFGNSRPSGRNVIIV